MDSLQRGKESVTVSKSKQCTARSKQTGKRCRQPTMEGKDVCRFHGGLSTGPTTVEGKARSAANALKHGAYAARILNDDEQALFRDVLARIHEDFSLNGSSDQVAAQSLALAYVQFLRAMEAGDTQATETFDRIVRCHLKDLKATKIVREGESGSDLSTSPAEWATALLEKVRKAEKQNGRGASSKRQQTGRGPRLTVPARAL